MAEGPLLMLDRVSRTFRRGRTVVHAVREVTLSLQRGTIYSLVGQSGSGKTTLARIVLGLLRPTEGRVLLEGRDTASFGRSDWLEYWRRVQGIFQDPYSSFNQFFRAGKVLHDAFRLLPGRHTREQRLRLIAEALEAVHLGPDQVLGRYPFELSGGQAQRLMIARALLIGPDLLIADEPTSMIDACSRAGILEALLGLRGKRGTTVVFITHDMGLAAYVSDQLHVMCEGRIVESGPPERLLQAPQHPYTQRLLADVPRLHGAWL